ncbi:MAG: NAD(P)-dependent alcohol dehydrogenase [Acidobacteriia bacterium]|nr:NAD(P)-dependent alcohol dehydrogenase [Terriglobia bacterium]
MRAIVCYRYGPPEVLKCEEIDKPIPADDEVLIKVRAASVNPMDRLFRGTSYLVRMLTGLRSPKNIRQGHDVAGQVEAVGKSVTKFKPGDGVFGASLGAFGEYVCPSERSVVLKPALLTSEQAAAVPVAGFTALQGLRDKGGIQPGQKVLINGASGGVGTFAVQIAKSFGAEVTAVCSTRNVDLVRSLGADHVIDYTQEDFTRCGQRYDIIFDCISNHSLSACRRILNPKGIYLIVGGPSNMAFLLTRVLKAFLLSSFVSQKFIFFVAKLKREDLEILSKLLESGKVTPVIDRRYTLSEVPDAIRYLEEGHARGKIVITVS